jgi:hypothetical protein
MSTNGAPETSITAARRQSSGSDGRRSFDPVRLPGAPPLDGYGRTCKATG